MKESLKALIDGLKLYHPQIIDLSLERISLLLKALGNPHHQLPPTFHIAGTNGKGSTIAFMKSILEAASYKVHTYTSPHLIYFNERINIQGLPICDEFLEDCLREVEKVLQKGLTATFFEATTAAAFLAFSKVPADFLLLETGLGGRLDATNIIRDPVSCIITSISYDHQRFLGTTLTKIAQEKLGIVKSSAPVVIAPQVSAVKSFYEKALLSHKKEVLCANRDWFVFSLSKGFKLCYLHQEITFPTPSLLGKHQHQNAATALVALSSLNLPISILKKGLERAVWAGRLQKVYFSSSDFFYLDGAHNIGGMKALRKFISETSPIQGPIIIGTTILNNRDPHLLLSFLKPLANEFFYIDCQNPDFHPFSAFPPYVSQSVPLNNLKEFLIKKEKPSRIFLTGSLYLVGDILKTLESGASSP